MRQHIVGLGLAITFLAGCGMTTRSTDERAISPSETSADSEGVGLANQVIFGAAFENGADLARFDSRSGNVRIDDGLLKLTTSSVAPTYAFRTGLNLPNNYRYDATINTGAFPVFGTVSGPVLCSVSDTNCIDQLNTPRNLTNAARPLFVFDYKNSRNYKWVRIEGRGSKGVGMPVTVSVDKVFCDIGETIAGVTSMRERITCYDGFANSGDLSFSLTVNANRLSIQVAGGRTVSVSIRPVLAGVRGFGFQATGASGLGTNLQTLRIVRLN